MSSITALAGRCQEIASKKLVVGFDGFTDTIARPLMRSATEHTPAQAFETIQDFGQFLVSKAEKSCSIELQIEARQLGGNLPFLSKGAGRLGLDVSCIGMLGAGGTVEDVFQEMPCTLYPYAPSGQSTCLEFQDGKVLLAADCKLEDDAWNLVMTATGQQAPALLNEADLIALVNWSELSFAHKLWKHTADVLRDVRKERFAFFDLCDVSRKTDAQIDEVLQLLGMFAKKRTAILSLNENEALTVSERVLHNCRDLSSIANAIHRQYGIDEVLIHTLHQSLLCSDRGIVCQDTYFVDHPMISTGAGDNFNAASCFAAVMGLSDEDRLTIANTFAHFYITKGYNPTISELLTHVQALAGR